MYSFIRQRLLNKSKYFSKIEHVMKNCNITIGSSQALYENLRISA